MCGRYSLSDKKFVNAKWAGFKNVVTKDGAKIEQELQVKPNYNVAPTQTMPVFTVGKDAVQLEFLQWGIVRQVGPDLKKQIINTRSDKAFEHFWNKIVTRERCLVPATSFFEWHTTTAGKKPYVIKPKDNEPFMFAGIVHDGTYSIMTTEPNREMRHIHNRMPVILHPEDYDKWLADTNKREDLEPLLCPYEDNGLEMYEVGTAVNNVSNNNIDLLVPVKA
jgi:putative SOS response-associated peptidase YedK